MSFTAGQKVRVSDLESIGGTMLFMTSDVTVNNTTSMSDATGLSLPVEASSRYAFDAWVMWTSTPAADAKFGWSMPASTTGWWSAMGPVYNQAPVTNSERQNYTDFGVLVMTDTISLAGDDESPSTIRVCATLRGFFETTNSGTFKLQFSQKAATVTDTVLRAGSRMQVYQLS